MVKKNDLFQAFNIFQIQFQVPAQPNETWAEAWRPLSGLTTAAATSAQSPSRSLSGRLCPEEILPAR